MHDAAHYTNRPRGLGASAAKAKGRLVMLCLLGLSSPFGLIDQAAAQAQSGPAPGEAPGQAEVRIERESPPYQQGMKGSQITPMDARVLPPMYPPPKKRKETKPAWAPAGTPD